jgi:hypothetical protein
LYFPAKTEKCNKLQDLQLFSKNWKEKINGIAINLRLFFFEVGDSKSFHPLGRGRLAF